MTKSYWTVSLLLTASLLGGCQREQEDYFDETPVINNPAITGERNDFGLQNRSHETNR